MAPKKVDIPLLPLNNGKMIPVFGLGTWKSKPGEVTQAVCDAIDLGYRHIDCAWVYENEKEVGAALKKKIDEGVVKRQDLFITSKLWNTFHRPDMVIKGIKSSLASLGLDYVDLYLIHWPFAYKEGEVIAPKDANGKIIYSDVDYVDTWKAMEELVGQGLTKSIGVSNFNSQQLERVLKIATIPPVTNQVESHPWLTQKKLADFCAERGIFLTAYSPLGSPDRPGAKPGDAGILDDPKVKKIGDKYGKTPAQILIRYQIDRGLVVIPKSVTKKRLEENINVFDFHLSLDDVKELDSLECNGRLCGLEFVKDHPHYGFSIEF